MGWTPLLLVVTPNVPAKTLSELMRSARDNPGNSGRSRQPADHLTMAQLRTRGKLDIASTDYPIDTTTWRRCWTSRSATVGDE